VNAGAGTENEFADGAELAVNRQQPPWFSRARQRREAGRPRQSLSSSQSQVSVDVTYAKEKNIRGHLMGASLGQRTNEAEPIAAGGDHR
jgi:hypothetical protein